MNLKSSEISEYDRDWMMKLHEFSQCEEKVRWKMMKISKRFGVTWRFADVEKGMGRFDITLATISISYLISRSHISYLHLHLHTILFTFHSLRLYHLSILVGGLEHLFHILGIVIPIDFHIFQMGWNHQPVWYFIIFPWCPDSFATPSPVAGTGCCDCCDRCDCCRSNEGVTEVQVPAGQGMWV